MHSVAKPELYGVAKLNKNKRIIQIKEKPKKFISDYAITGLYFFDNKVINFSKKLKPSQRGEIEIVDLLNEYKKRNMLYADFIGRGGAWLDTGSIEDFYKTTAFVSSIENRQGLKVACLEEIAFSNGWIDSKDLEKSIEFLANSEYGLYLKNFLDKN